MVIGMCVSFVCFGVYFDIVFLNISDSSFISSIVLLLGFKGYFIEVLKIFWLLILCLVLFNLVFLLVWGFVFWFIMLEIFFVRV